MENDTFIEECIIDVLNIDHGSYENIQAGADHKVGYDELALKNQLIALVDRGHVDACLYDSQSKELKPVEFNQAQMSTCWFYLTDIGTGASIF